MQEMGPYSLFTRCFRPFFLAILVCAAPRAHGTPEALGLKIDWSRFSVSQDNGPTFTEETTPVPCDHLTDVTYNSAVSITEVVDYKLFDPDTDVGLPFDHDTDTEEEQGVAQIAREEGSSQATEIDSKIDSVLPEATRNARKLRYINRSRFRTARETSQYDPAGNYVKSELPTNFVRQLANDAQALLGSLPDDRSRSSTTYLCVALRDRNSYIKRFVFHNGAHLMLPKVREKAYMLGYDVIQVEQSHAEGQFVQFLLRRHQVRPGWYTHIMGLGCSRRLCVECNHLLKMFLGDHYHPLVASYCDSSQSIVVTEDVGKLFMNNAQDDATNTSFEPMYNRTAVMRVPGTVLGVEAIDHSTYPNYYMPISLKQAIQNPVISSGAIILSNQRFDKSGESGTGGKRRRGRNLLRPAG